ncbi:hypothetical protein V6N13_015332 [Hibiscus sabdariffa]|uniref:RIN4 pathogenic type III effector avirulence factor Avr cleavage site domain-containing protein n=1 Tax=Hibiscus sabdariffa TaxID=183260 RepID=A0ABR2CVC4_9ROSI
MADNPEVSVEGLNSNWSLLDPLAADSAVKHHGDRPSRQNAVEKSGPLDHHEKSGSLVLGSGSENSNSGERKAGTGRSLVSSGSGPSNKSAGDKHRRAPSIPKFGDWDESDPASCENLTAIFESVKEEKKSPSFPTSPPQSSQTKRGVPSWFSKVPSVV